MALMALLMARLGSHNQLALVFGLLGISVSMLVYLAPLPTFKRIYKKKSTEGFQSLPYLVALFSSMLWFYYALLKKDAVLFIINSIGCGIEMIYIVMYMIYAPRNARNLTIKLFAAMNVGCFALILLVTQFALHDAHLRLHVLGWICVFVSVSVFAAPLNIVRQVVRTKSVQFMPFYLSLFLTLSAVMWFFYGLFNKDICVTIPNVLGFILGFLQMVLYVVYRRRNGGDVEMQVVVEEKEQTLEQVVKNIHVGSSDQVFPITEDAIGDVNKLQLQETNIA